MPPSEKPAARGASDVYAAAALGVRRQGFWSSWRGIAATVFISLVVVALYVGWVLLWVFRPEGPSVTLLSLGTLGFGAVLVALVMLLTTLRRSVRLHNAEATFLTAVSHHLRTPIAGIRAAAQVLELPEVAPDERTRLTAAIVGETDRLARLVENVLETGRLEIGRHTLGHEPIDLGALVSAAVRERRAGTTGELSLSIEGDHPVIGDRHSLRLLLDNLLDNAIQYGGSQPVVRVSVARSRGWIVLSVEDEGRGFEPGTESRLFVRFRRGDCGGARGWGLGLALSRAIARAHGGEIRLESEGVGRGAIATVSLPPTRGTHERTD